MESAAHILLIDDDENIGASLTRVLASEGHTVILEQRGDRGLERAIRETFDVVVTDFRLPGLSGLELVKQIHAARPHLPIILMTAHGTAETAIEATKLGAFDYLLKPFDMPVLLELVSKAARASRMMSKPVALGHAPKDRDSIVGRSAAMQAVYKEIGLAASKPVNVLIRGETGTGKELIARAIYQHGDRAGAPFIAINCAAIPETLLESELFGHERGAFTGAQARRIGRFEQANHGTIFLDEIGDMTSATQVKLVRVLQERTIQRLGGNEDIPVDVRVIAATHRDLDRAIKEKQFREDLYYRLSVVVISLPPLRQRTEDIPELVQYFLQKFGAELALNQSGIDAPAVEFLKAQSWPGNVRELENVLRKALLLAQGYTINAEHVRSALTKGLAPMFETSDTLGHHVDELLAAASRDELDDAHARLIETAERELFSRAMERAQGNQAQVARWLGLSRLTVREKLLHFGLHPRQEQNNS